MVFLGFQLNTKEWKIRERFSPTKQGSNVKIRPTRFVSDAILPSAASNEANLRDPDVLKTVREVN